MIVRQQILTRSDEPLTLWEGIEKKPQLCLLFGPAEGLRTGQLQKRLRDAFPHTLLVGCSTAGEITRDRALQNIFTVTAFASNKTRFRISRASISDEQSAVQTGELLGRSLWSDDLRYVFVLYNGLITNDILLLAGLRGTLGKNTVISGGFAGDDDTFAGNVLVEDDVIYTNNILAVGFYGTSLHVRSASGSGWIPYGPHMTITKSAKNIVRELDGKRALDIYKDHIGTDSDRLPATGLLHPLWVQSSAGDDSPAIRVIYAVNPEQGTINLSGPVSDGDQVRLMLSNYTQLIGGAADAARRAAFEKDKGANIAIINSCSGRRTVLGVSTDLEIEAIASRLPACPIFTGFYGNAEIGAHETSGRCELLNQSVVVTQILEE